MMDDEQLLHAYARERSDAKDPRLGLDRTRQLPTEPGFNGRLAVPVYHATILAGEHLRDHRGFPCDPALGQRFTPAHICHHTLVGGLAAGRGDVPQAETPWKHSAGRIGTRSMFTCDGADTSATPSTAAPSCRWDQKWRE